VNKVVYGNTVRKGRFSWSGGAKSGPRPTQKIIQNFFFLQRTIKNLVGVCTPPTPLGHPHFFKFPASVGSRIALFDSDHNECV